MLSNMRFKQEGQESNSGSSADVLFGVFLFFVSGEGGKFARAQISRMWASGRERSLRAWSTSIGECPATGFPSATFALVCAMVGLGDFVFGFSCGA